MTLFYNELHLEILRELRELREDLKAIEILSRPLPRCDWIAWVLPSSLRERVFDPAYNDALAEYLEGKGTPFRFAVHAAWLAAVSLCVGVIGAVTTAALAPVRRWFTGFRSDR